MVAPSHGPRHLDEAERSVGSPWRRERMGSDALPRAGPRQLWVGGARGSWRPLGWRRDPRAPPEKGLALDARSGGRDRPGAALTCWLRDRTGLVGAGTEGARGRAARKSAPEPHRLERVRRGARAEPGLTVWPRAAGAGCSCAAACADCSPGSRWSKDAASHHRGWGSERRAPRLLSPAPRSAARSVLRERRRLCCAARPGAEGGDRPPPPRRTLLAEGEVQANERPGAGLGPGQRWGAG